VTRIQLELPEDRVRELDELMDQTGLSTRKDLLNQALTLFKWALRERQAGRMIASVDEAQNRYKELSMPALETGAARSHAKETAAF
jgi:metal-responsive CopG/Arc/MetJ family transcriptional regulator